MVGRNLNQDHAKSPVTFALLSTADVAATADLVSRVFSEDEPLAIAAGQTKDELFAMMSAVGASALSEALSIGAWVDGELVGVAITTVFTWLPPEGTEALSPNYSPIAVLIEELEADFHARPREELETCAHIHMLAVGRGFRDRKIAGSLVQRCIENAASKGFTEIVTDATNPASQSVFVKAKFERLAKVSYDSFTFEGRRVFSGIPNATDTALMGRVL